MAILPKVVSETCFINVSKNLLTPAKCVVNFRIFLNSSIVLEFFYVLSKFKLDNKGLTGRN